MFWLLRVSIFVGVLSKPYICVLAPILNYFISMAWPSEASHKIIWYNTLHKKQEGLTVIVKLTVCYINTGNF